MVKILVVICWLLLVLICALAWILMRAQRGSQTMAEIERYWDGEERRRVERRKAGMR